MLGVTAGAVCERVEETGHWDVFCLRCQTSIGTFDSETLRVAVHSTMFRGGILCPECRSESCMQCGNELRAKGWYHVSDKSEVKGPYCLFCDMEIEEEETMKTLAVVPCLVPQNSKKGQETSTNGYEVLGEPWSTGEEDIGKAPGEFVLEEDGMWEKKGEEGGRE